MLRGDPTLRWRARLEIKPRRRLALCLVGDPKNVFVVKSPASAFGGKKKGRRDFSGATGLARCGHTRVTYQKIYLLSAMGLAPKSRRPLTAVRAARAAGILAAAAP